MTNAMAASARVARVLTGGGRRAFASVRGDVIQVTNPATGAVVARVPADDDMSVARKFVEASRAQRKWASTPASDRAACLRRYAQLLKDKANDLASDITSEMGKPRTHAKAEVLAAARRVEAIVDIAVSENLAPSDDDAASEFRGHFDFGAIGVCENLSGEIVRFVTQEKRENAFPGPNGPDRRHKNPNRVAAAHEGGGAPSSEGSDVRRATDPGRRARPADFERKRRAPGGAGDAGARASTRVARTPWWRGKASPAYRQRCRTVCVHFQVVGSRARGSAACGRGWQKRDECAVLE